MTKRRSDDDLLDFTQPGVAEAAFALADSMTEEEREQDLLENGFDLEGLDAMARDLHARLHAIDPEVYVVDDPVADDLVFDPCRARPCHSDWCRKCRSRTPGRRS